MTFLALDAIKAHLRITGTDDDVLLDVYSTAVAEHINTILGRSYTVDTVPSSVRAAGLLLVADLYENREGQTVDLLKPNRTVDMLLGPNRVF